MQIGSGQRSLIPMTVLRLSSFVHLDDESRSTWNRNYERYYYSRKTTNPPHLSEKVCRQGGMATPSLGSDPLFHGQLIDRSLLTTNPKAHSAEGTMELIVDRNLAILDDTHSIFASGTSCGPETGIPLRTSRVSNSFPPMTSAW